MTSKLIKVIVGSLVGVMSLTTTAVAGYKVYKGNSVKAEASNFQRGNSPTPRVEEIIEEDKAGAEETKTFSPTPSPSTIQTESPKSPLKESEFEDQGDDDVEFEQINEKSEKINDL